MARRMSNRARIERMRDEAHLAEREKKSSAAADTGRMKIVWGIKNGAGEIIAAFPYPEKARAEAEAERLRNSGQRGCIVCPHKVPF